MATNFGGILMLKKKFMTIFGHLGLIFSGIAGILFQSFNTFYDSVLICCLIMILAGGVLLILTFIPKLQPSLIDAFGEVNHSTLIWAFLIATATTIEFLRSVFWHPPAYEHIPIPRDFTPATYFPFVFWFWYMAVVFTLAFKYKT